VGALFSVTWQSTLGAALPKDSLNALQALG
jgi:hypothetical protein